jgi:uncharacterized phage protein gp47/JayE
VAPPRIKDRRELVNEFLRRFITYTDRVTWFGNNSTVRAFAIAFSAWVEGCHQLYVALVRRYTVMGSSGDTLSDVCAERGVVRRGATRSKLAVVLSPIMADVLGVSLGTGPVGAGDEIEIEDSTNWQVGDSIRIRNGDGTVSDVRTITGITLASGPVAGGDELEVAVLTGVYTPATDDVDVLLRITVPAGEVVNTTEGPTFQTLENVTTGDANPIMDGESISLGLADKVWCEAVTPGVDGNVDGLTVTDFATTYRIADVFNPERATGGADEETDYELKYRTVHAPTVANQETLTWIEALMQASNNDVLRAIHSTGSAIGTLYVKVLRTNGGTFSAAELAALDAYVGSRVRSYLKCSCDNVSLTSVEVEAIITLEPGYSLEDVWRAASDALTDFIDYRTWAWGQDVDEADLLTIVNNTAGVATLETATFLPAADVSVADDSLPVLVRLSLQDSTTGNTYNAALAVGF